MKSDRSQSVKQVLDSSVLVSLAYLEGFDALVEFADIECLCHVDCCSVDFLHVEGWLFWLDNDFNLDEKFLAEGAALGTMEAQVDLADFVASSDALTLQWLELISYLDRNI